MLWRTAVSIECIQTKGAVAVHDDDLLVGLGDLRTDSERQSDAHGAEWSGIEAMPRGKSRMTGELIDLLENLAAALADRARTANRHDWAVIDQRVGDAGGEVDYPGTACRHAA